MNFVSGLRDIILKSDTSHHPAGVSLFPTPSYGIAPCDRPTLNPIISRCISALLGLGMSVVAFHFLLKLMKQMDPTQKDKDRAEMQVC